MYEGEPGYLQLLQDVLTVGERRSNRTGTDTMSIVGPQISFDLIEGFPLITTKRVWWKGIAVELDWMLQGLSNVEYLENHGVKIWTPWAEPDGDLGPVYGVQWRRWPRKGRRFDADSWRADADELLDIKPYLARQLLQDLQRKLRDPGLVRDAHAQDVLPRPSSFAPIPVDSSSDDNVLSLASARRHDDDLWDAVAAKDPDAMIQASEQLYAAALALNQSICIDQIAQIVDKLRHHREDRRIILSAWNVGEIQKMKLPPCHYAAQFLVSNSGDLTCIVSIRSWDLFLGGPFNIGQYALLTHLLAHVSGLKADRVVFNAGDAHIYVNHIDQVREQCERPVLAPPTIDLSGVSTDDIDAFRWDQAKILGYESHPALRGEIAV